jgi:NAD-dependent dihydropyrimidine dehydrogenase PreA subunit
MSVLINFKICDNAKECLGIEACPTGALYWNEKEKTIKYDKNKCNLCKLCEVCEVDAIKVATNDKEYKKYKQEIDNDPRKTNDLFIDRYGATPVHPAFQMSQKEFDHEILDATKLTILEIYNEDSIRCLLSSIPIKEIFKDIDCKYRKMIISDESILKKYNIKDLPSLLFFNQGKLIGSISGFYEVNQKQSLKDKIDEILA